MGPMSLNFGHHDGSPFDGPRRRAGAASFLLGYCLLPTSLRIEKEIEEAPQLRSEG